MKRNLWFWLYFIAAILLAIYFAARIIMARMGYGPTAMIRHISISAETTNRNLLSSIENNIGIQSGTHTYTKKLEHINTQLKQKIPNIEKSAVRRLPNGNLAIKVNFYKAVAEITNGVYYYPLSDKGECIETPSETRSAGSIVFHGECITECKEKPKENCEGKKSKECEPKILVLPNNDKSEISEKCQPNTAVLRGRVPNEIGEITKAAHNLIGDLDYLEWIDGRRWNLVTLGGITIMLPENNPISAIGNIVMLDKKHNILSKDIKVIDMRDDTRILVK
jgi:cell division septal protein FtsQ